MMSRRPLPLSRVWMIWVLPIFKSYSLHLGKPQLQKIIRITQFFPSFFEGEESEALMVGISENELKGVLHSFQKDKISGLDKWLIEFYLDFFEIIGRDLLRVVEESRVTGYIHSTINSTLISLTPKTDLPLSFDEYKTISLYNCL